ncbi:MAG: hypothetical protein HZB85_06275 [Deltaproteobacteria bacterium]|nr:hypothetical protein [Deltaproteobacteria bacterium]
MNADMRFGTIRLLEEAIGFTYPLRWVDEKTSIGEFDGRDFAIDVFNISLAEQLNFLARIRDLRDKIHEMIGSRCLFIFHSPEATKRHYAHIFPRLEGVCIEKERVHVLLFSSVESYCGIEINDTIYIPLKVAA